MRSKFSSAFGELGDSAGNVIAHSQGEVDRSPLDSIVIVAP
jgi:hypothetical protein